MTGLLALTGAENAFAQGKPPAKAAGKAPAKPGAKGPAKGPAKPAPKKPMTEKQKKDAARKHYKEGEAKFKEGKYQEALEQYKDADDLLPIAATKYKMAVCRDKLGQVIEAAGAYQVFLDSSPDPAKMSDAIADARSRLDALKKTPGKIRIAIEPPTVPKLMISVDNGHPQPARVETMAVPAPPPPAGQPAPPPATVQGVQLSMAPGHHKITAVGEGFDPSSTELDLGFAETRDARIALHPTPPPPPTPIAQNPEPTPPPAPPPPPPAPRSNVPAYVTLGLAGAGLIVGGAFGGLALKSKGDFNSAVTAKKSASELTDLADKTDRNALISDMSFAVALTFGVTGAVLLLSNDSPAQEQQKTGAAAPKKKSAVRGFVTPYFSPQGGGAAALVTF